MNIKAKVALGCYVLVALLLAVMGVIYLTRSQFMPYHAAAVGQSWDQLSPQMQVLILGFLEVAGGGFLTAALAIGLFLFIPFRRGERWANWAILATGLTSGVPALYATIMVARSTPASPPWIAAAAGLCLTVVGSVFGAWGSKR